MFSRFLQVVATASILTGAIAYILPKTHGLWSFIALLAWLGAMRAAALFFIVRHEVEEQQKAGIRNQYQLQQFQQLQQAEIIPFPDQRIRSIRAVQIDFD